MKEEEKNFFGGEEYMNETMNETRSTVRVRINHSVPDLSFEVYHDEKVKKVQLSDYKGKWLVLLFYPADFTFVCPTELSDAAKLYDEFTKAGAEVISMSTDTVFVHKAWHDHSESIKNVTYPMGADPTREVSRTFGTLIEEEGLSLRGTFIIDPDGKLVASSVHSNDIGRNAHEILRQLQAAQYVRENPGQVCPANWTPGAKTLKPGLDLVGKI